MFTAQRLSALILGLAFSASAQAANQTTTNLPEQDQSFATIAASDSKAEIELGRISVKRTQDLEVRQFAERMLVDHGAANKELTAIMREMRVPERLAKMSGVAFDREYMKVMVASHDKAVALFADETEGGRNDKLKAFAKTMLPKLRDHLGRARDITDRLTSVAGADQNVSHAQAWQDHAQVKPGLPIAERTAADLVEQPVITPGGEGIGTIKDIVIDSSSGAVYAIIPVGGALGIADKGIAVDMRELRTGKGKAQGGMLVMATASEEKLEEWPPFDSSDERYVRYPDYKRIGESGRL